MLASEWTLPRPAPRRREVAVRSTATPISIGQLAALLPSWPLHLDAVNLAPRTIRAHTGDGALLAAFLAERGMPGAVRAVTREHVETFIAAELARTSPTSAATRYRSIQQLFRWLLEGGRNRPSPMARMRPPRIPKRPVPIFTDGQLLAAGVLRPITA